MLKEHSSFVKQAIATIDLLLLTLSFYLSHTIVSEHRNLADIYDYWLMFVGFVAFYLYFGWTRSLFSVLDFGWMRALGNRIVMIFLSAGILGAAILYVLPDIAESRTLYVLFACISFVFIASEKLVLKYVFARLRRGDRNTTPVIMFGRGRFASQVEKQIELHPEWGLRVRNKLDISTTPHEFEEILKNSYVEEVLFCIPRTLSRESFTIDPYLRTCEEMGRSARVFINISSSTRFAKWEYRRFVEYPTLLSYTVQLDPDQLFFKRVFDIIGAIVGVTILVLLYPPLALAIKLSSPGPIFFKQVRVGRNGKRFVIYKFRSMRADAEAKKKELEKLNECQGAVFKMKDDPRVTTVGQIMRKLSLDELPQFINVLKGEMSLVGTRPPTPDEVSKYQKWHHRRISTRPGITGLWQVSGRNSISDFDEIVRLDLKYIDSWSIWLDIQLILKTFIVVFRRDNAY